MRGVHLELTQFELQFIRDYATKLKDEEILERLNVLRKRSQKPLLSTPQITKRRQRMGISKKRGPKGQYFGVRQSGLVADLKYINEDGKKHVNRLTPSGLPRYNGVDLSMNLRRGATGV